MTSVAPGGPAPVTARGGLRLRLAGGFAVERDGVAVDVPATASRKARTVLKLLAVERGRVVPVDRLVDVLWPDAAPARAADNVATLVSRLRAWLGPDAVEGGRDGYRLGGSVDLDIDDAHRLVGRSEQELAAGRAGLALPAAEQACALLDRGDLLADEPYSAWVEPARAAHRLLRRSARVAHVRAALAAGAPDEAVGCARLGVEAEPYDEELVRLLMQSHRAAGESAAALLAFAALRERLADELGADPDPETAALHAALLRDEPARDADPGGAVATVGPGAAASGLVDRDAELAALRSAWAGAALRRTSLCLVVGEAGIGKTSLVESLAVEAAGGGAHVLRARCYEAERSLFLQPLVDALRPELVRRPAHQVRELAGPHVEALVGLVPELADGLGPVRPTRIPADVARRRAFDAVLHVLRSLSQSAPVLVVLDDLHQAGSTTVEAVHYLARRGETARLLLLATVRREEGAPALATLAPVATEVEPGVLTREGVLRLATEAGHADQADAIAASTGGHPFFVAEVLRGLAAGQETLPESLQAAVASRVARVGEPVERALRAAAVLGAEVDPAQVATLLGAAEDDVAGRCERALTARLLTVSGRAYEFANDLIREALYATTPAPTRLGWHRRAADLAADNAEAMARHARAAGETGRAARAWLVAAEEALTAVAASDAEALAEQACACATEVGAAEVLGRALLVRAHAREIREAYQDALDDLLAAAQVAHDSGDRRLEMAVLRELGYDVPVALGMGTRYNDPHLDRALALARSLGDRTSEADLLARRAILASNRLQLRAAHADAEAAVAAARAGGGPEALVAALDGRKNVMTALGDIPVLTATIEELEPELRRLGDLFRLQWCVFESALPAFAAADWAETERRIAAALVVNRRSGYLPYGLWFQAHLGAVLRLQGRDEEALEVGRRAVESPAGRGHPWWRPMACRQLSATLLELGAVADAVVLGREALEATGSDRSEGHVLPCLAQLARATGDASLRDEADAMMRAVETPPGRVWLFGFQTYVDLAEAWRASGEPGRARELAGPLVAAARAQSWRPALACGLLADARAAQAAGDGDAADLAKEAADVASTAGMPRIARRARALLR